MIVAGDPLARAGLKRTSAGRGECDWCGRKCRRVFIYVLGRDGDRGAEFWDRLNRGGIVFCNLSCYRSYFSSGQQLQYSSQNLARRLLPC
jgi:hypothetical protein